MGIFWRPFALKPVKGLERPAHRLDLAGLKAEDAIVDAVRGKRRRR